MGFLFTFLTRTYHDKENNGAISEKHWRGTLFERLREKPYQVRRIEDFTNESFKNDFGRTGPDTWDANKYYISNRKYEGKRYIHQNSKLFFFSYCEEIAWRSFNSFQIFIFYHIPTPINGEDHPLEKLFLSHSV